MICNFIVRSESLLISHGTINSWHVVEDGQILLLIESGEYMQFIWQLILE